MPSCQSHLAEEDTSPEGVVWSAQEGQRPCWPGRASSHLGNCSSLVPTRPSPQDQRKSQQCRQSVYFQMTFLRKMASPKRLTLCLECGETNSCLDSQAPREAPGWGQEL